MAAHGHACMQGKSCGCALVELGPTRIFAACCVLRACYDRALLVGGFPAPGNDTVVWTGARAPACEFFHLSFRMPMLCPMV